MKIGLFTDVHYGAGVKEGTRHCHLGLRKLRHAMRAFALENVALVVGLGDLVDSAETAEQEAAWLEEICQAVRGSGIAHRFVPGNHCIWTLNKAQYLRATGMNSTWGKLQLGTWRLLFLDGCFRNDGVPYGQRNNDWRDARISDEQVAWLDEELHLPHQPPTAVFVHQRLDVEPPYGVSNAKQIRRLLERPGAVKMVFQGHEHAGATTDIGGIRHVTLPALVEGRESVPYAIGNLAPDGTIGVSMRVDRLA